MKKVGLALEGGAICGAFTAGVLEVFQEKNITFPYIIGVSAGGGNAMNFVAGQAERTMKVIAPENNPYYGVKAMIKSRKLVDLNKMFFVYPYEDYPFDFKTFFASETECEFALTDCQSGEAAYFSEKSNEKRFLTIGMASCSLPIISKPVEIDGKFYMDGSIADSLLVNRAFDKGCDKVVAVLTKSAGESHTDYCRFRLLLKKLYRSRFPNFEKACLERCCLYRKQERQLKKLESEGKAFVIRSERHSIKNFENDHEKIEAYHEHGKKVAEERLEELLDFMNK